MLPELLVVGPTASAQAYVRDRGWPAQCVDYAASADEMHSIFDPVVHERLDLVDIARLAAEEITGIAEQLRTIRLVWPEIFITDFGVVAQIDADPGRVPVLV